MDHVGWLSLRCGAHVGKKYLENQCKTSRLSRGPFVVVAVFRYSLLRIAINSLQNIMYFHRFLKKCRFHTRIFINFRRMNHVSIKMTAVLFKKCRFHARIFINFRRANQASIKMIAAHVIKYQYLLRNYTHFRTSVILPPRSTWWTLISLIKLIQLCAHW